MGVEERRERERQARRQSILRAAELVAENEGWSAFSMEKVAAQAEIGRATIYTYFLSIDDLVACLADIAVERLAAEAAVVETAAQALDVPVRLAQRRPAEFELLFPQGNDKRAHMSSRELSATRARARELLETIERISARWSATLPEESQARSAFLAGVSMAGATVPELKSSTTLRHRFHDFCLGSSAPLKPER